MLKAELLEVIASGENSGVEFKRDDILQAIEDQKTDGSGGG